MYSSVHYKVGGALMAISPVALMLVWVTQIIMFDLEDQADPFITSLPANIVLLVAIKTICLPWVRGQRFQEHGGSDEVLNLRIKRPITHMNPTDASAHNSIWSLNIMRALLLAKLGRYDVMKDLMFVDWDG